jgi:ribose-phosphate pyrophosphokinase
LVIVSPDAGGVARARKVADILHALGVVTILKRRVAANVIEEMQLVGDVSGKICVIIDDMIDTAGR